MKGIRVKTFPRPYVITFHATGEGYPLSQEEVDRLLAEYPVVSANFGDHDPKVVLRGDAATANKATIRPATLGGGSAFEKVESGSAAGEQWSQDFKDRIDGNAQAIGRSKR